LNWGAAEGGAKTVSQLSCYRRLSVTLPPYESQQWLAAKDSSPAGSMVAFRQLTGQTLEL
jgi:hypothetical protein